MTRPSTARLLGAVFVVVAVALLVLGVVKLLDDGGGDSTASNPSVAAAVRAATPATAPFPGLTRTRVAVGTKVLDVVVADSETERETGLRRRSDLGPYGGMLFVFPSPTTVGFTMSTVPVPLDIAFYDASGAVVDRLHMKPCPGTDATCPVYRARAPFSYALETVGGAAPAGRLQGVPAAQG